MTVVVGQIEAVIAGDSFEGQIVIPQHVGRHEGVREAARHGTELLARVRGLAIPAYPSLVERDLVGIAVRTQSLIGADEYLAAVAGGHAHAAGPAVTQVRVETEPGPDPQAVDILGGVKVGVRPRGDLATRRIDRVE